MYDKEYLSKPLISFSSAPDDVWRVDDAFKGIAIFGGTGSGKTSGSGRAIAMKFLKEGWGGIVLCAKNEEADLWEDEYCFKAGRSKDVIRFKKGAIHGEKTPFAGKAMIFNPIDYEMKRAGEGAGDTQNLTNIFMNIYRMGNRIAGENDTNEQRFWDTALKRCLNRVIELIKLAKEDLSYTNMTKVISSSNGLNDDMAVKAVVDLKTGDKEKYKYLGFERNYCLKCLAKAYLRRKNAEEQVSYNHAVEYFLKALPEMAPKTKTIIFESFMGIAEPFLFGILNKHFAGATNLFPEWVYTGYDADNTGKYDKSPKIILLDFPIKEFLDAGIVAQSIFKLMFQQAMERRNTGQNPVPVFLWCDEAQYFINPYDQLFLTTARSSKTSTVYLSQNISNYLAIMTKPKVDSLLGNLSTKIFHANSDAETNEYASRLIGNEMEELLSAGHSHPHFTLEMTESENVSSMYLPQVKPKYFITQKSGGASHNYKVGAVIVVSGREWGDGNNYLITTFSQNLT